MDRLESAERRLWDLVARLEQQMSEAMSERNRSAKALTLAKTIEKQSAVAIKQAKDLIRSNEGQ